MTLGQQVGGRELKGPLVVVGIAFVVGLLLLAGRLYRLQITRGEEFVAKSAENFIKEVRIRADRGMIRDRHGEILVENRPSFDVFITPAFCQKCDKTVLPRLAQLLSWDDEKKARAELAMKTGFRQAPFRPVAVGIDLPRDEVDVLSARAHELPEVDVQPVPHRSYRAGPVLAHVVGYMNEIGKTEIEDRNKTRTTPGSQYLLGDFIGREGIEKVFEEELRGKDGFRKEVVDAKGKTIPELNDLTGGGDLAPSAGHNVVLSVDFRLQQEAERAFPGVAGAVVALEAKTGFILAMVSRPSYDPNVLTGRVTPEQMAQLAKDPLKPMIFRPVQERYSPGSTFKPVTQLAALRSGTFSRYSSAFCSGSYRLGNRAWRCHKDHGHGQVDAKAAMRMSCDVWFYKVGDTLGLQPIADVGRELGLGRPTGLGVYNIDGVERRAFNETAGIMPDPEYHDRMFKLKRTDVGYTKGAALNSAIGQGDVNVTPLQLAEVYAAIGNGGHVFKPQLVKQIESVDGHVVRKFEPEVHRELTFTPEHHSVLLDSLTSVVQDPGGTAYSKRLPDIRVAGKTGTAQVVRLGATRLKTEQMDYWSRDHAWFASFAPAEDPEIVVVVLNEHGGHGGSDAAPTAMAVIKKYFELKAADKAGSATGAVPVAPLEPAPTGGGR